MAARYKQPPELQTGMFVILRDRDVGVVINDIIMGIDWFNPVNFYSIRDGHIQTWRWKFSSEDEFSHGSTSDIIAIYEVKDVGTCLKDIMKEDALQEYGKLLWEDTEKMKNIEKFKEVFGFNPRVDACLSYICSTCPLRERGREYACCPQNRVDWWNSEYNNEEN